MTSSSRTHALSRRAFLGALGATAAASHVFRPGRLSAQTMPGSSTPPKRFIFMFSANGIMPDTWHPTAGASETDFTLRGVLAPLAVDPWMKSKLIVLQGVDNKSAQNGGPGSPHARGMGSLLTGRELLAGAFHNNGGDSGYANGISLDQYLGNTLHARTLNLGVWTHTSDPVGRLSYAGPNRPVPTIDDPYEAFTQLFGDLALGAAELRRLHAQRQSVLDFVAQDLDELRGSLGADDRARIETHLASVRALEQSVLADAAPAPGTTACAPPDLGPRPADTAWYNHTTNYPRVGRNQMDLLVAALACRRVQVATLQWAFASSYVVHDWLRYNGAPITGYHHGLSHLQGRTGSDATTAAAQLAMINTFYAEQFAYLVRALNAVREPDGSTLLDHTVLVWGNELGNGSTHSLADVPFVMAGSCGGYFRTGRLLRFSGQSHSRLLVSLCNAMGATNTSFGNPAYGTGPLPGLH